jgi:hypothetical protein
MEKGKPPSEDWMEGTVSFPRIKFHPSIDSIVPTNEAIVASIGGEGSKQTAIMNLLVSARLQTTLPSSPKKLEPARQAGHQPAHAIARRAFLGTLNSSTNIAGDRRVACPSTHDKTINQRPPATAACFFIGTIGPGSCEPLAVPG